MQTPVTPLDGRKAIGITFTDKPMTDSHAQAFWNQCNRCRIRCSLNMVWHG